MFVDYKLAYRYLRKIKAMSLINISGLALGIIACLFIVHFVKMESGMNVFPQKKDLTERFLLRSDEEDETLKKNLKGYELLTLEERQQKIYHGEEIPLNEHISYQFIIGISAFFILVILGVNMLSFTTARSEKIAQEKSMHKILDTMRRYLSWHFLIESLFISFIGLLVSIIVLQFILPYFNKTSGLSLTIDQVLSSLSLSYLLLGVVLVGIVSGLYPTLFLACFKPTIAHKNTFKISEQRGLLRKSLVAFQFSIALFIIVGSIIILDELDYLTQKKMALLQEQSVRLPILEEHFNLETSTHIKTEHFPETKNDVAHTRLRGCPFSLHTIRKEKAQPLLNMSVHFMDNDFFSLLEAFFTSNMWFNSLSIWLEMGKANLFRFPN